MISLIADTRDICYILDNIFKNMFKLYFQVYIFWTQIPLLHYMLWCLMQRSLICICFICRICFMMNASCSRCYLNPTLTQPPGGTQFTIGKSHLCICYIYIIYITYIVDCWIVIDRVSLWVGERIGGMFVRWWVLGWVDEWMDLWMSRWMCLWVCGWVGEWVVWVCE